MTEPLLLVSADSHIDEPHDLWFERLPAALQPGAPRKIARGDEGAWSLLIEGERLDWVGSFAELTRVGAVVDPDARLAAIAADGVSAEMIYPTIGLYLWSMRDADLGRQCCRIYNDWIIGTLGRRPDRFRCAGMVPAWSVDAAIAEVEYLAAAGFASVMLPLVGTPEWNHRQWEPLWSAIAATKLPITLHQGSGHDMLFYRGPGAATVNLLATQTKATRAVALFTMSRVLERHPQLHLVFVEVNGGWLPWLMATLDEYALAHDVWARPKLREKPSAYIRDHFHVTFQRDPVALANLTLTGPDVLLWGSDYQHPESTYPRSVATVRELFAGVDPRDRDYIVAGHAAVLFGFDVAALCASAAGVGTGGVAP
jgi:predicted TIM-barrel fold metal-dependent hydrolase